VAHEQERAAENGQSVLTTVSLSTAICPECGRIYVSGGTTKTLTVGEKQSGFQQQEEDKGGLINVLA
jgi:hypothetical protein